MTPHVESTPHRAGDTSELRVQDVRDVYRLIGDCRDLGAEPALWHSRLLEGGVQLAGGGVAVAAEGTLDAPNRLRPIARFGAGLDSAGQRALAHWERDIGTSGCPLFARLLSEQGSLRTFTRTALLKNAAWYRSSSFEYRRPAQIDHQLTSLCVRSDGAYSLLCLNQPAGAPDFSERQRQLLHFLHGELAPLIGRALVSASDRGLEGLSRRLRQTLACLLQGDSEKQIALRLRLSVPTVHQYVMALYRHFGVRSRAQLSAYVLRRAARGPWAALLRDVPQQ